MNMSPHSAFLTRRDFLGRGVAGLGAAALATLLNPRLFSAAAARPGLPHFAPKAKRVIWLTQAGAPSQIDLLDYKPGLASRFGTDLPHSVRGGQRLTGMTSEQKHLRIAPSIFPFQQHGQSGLWVSDLLPHTAKLADEICVVRSMHTEAINHDPVPSSPGARRSVRGPLTGSARKTKICPPSSC